jgi:hypothetical protein
MINFSDDQQLWNVSITVSALLSGMDTISNHPVAGYIAVESLSFLFHLELQLTKGLLNLYNQISKALFQPA